MRNRLFCRLLGISDLEAAPFEVDCVVLERVTVGEEEEGSNTNVSWGSDCGRRPDCHCSNMGNLHETWDRRSIK